MALKSAIKSNNICTILSDLINKSFNEGIFANELKLAKVVPIFKSGKRTDLSNYRPISLLSVFSHFFEKTMHVRLESFLRKHSTIYDYQFGFRKQHSCEHALLAAQSNLLEALNKKQIALLLLVDFSKAFDMVDHNILNKLEHYGIHGNAFKWLSTYLKGRKQYVHVNGTSSEIKSLEYGVPQGSILGPLLFVIYINDLPHSSELAKFILYADDANIIITADNELELQNK